jgi:hypothetical protein
MTIAGKKLLELINYTKKPHNTYIESHNHKCIVSPVNV